ncbi:MAG: hypothetical protein E7665_06545 [Ruminococcaceae bacterium]|nr:hypothetical protein [Oscillospiraceae bacterium]
MKRAISAMLALLMLAFVLVSCGDNTPATQGTTPGTTPATGTASTEPTEEVKIVPDIPEELKFEDQEFVILALGENYGETKGRDFLVLEEAEGELINTRLRKGSMRLRKDSASP